MKLLGNWGARGGCSISLGIVLIVVCFRAVGNHDDQSDNDDQGQNQPHFNGFRAGIENIVTHCSVDNKGENDEAHQDGEFFQGVIPQLEASWG